MADHRWPLIGIAISPRGLRRRIRRVPAGRDFGVKAQAHGFASAVPRPTGAPTDVLLDDFAAANPDAEVVRGV